MIVAIPGVLDGAGLRTMRGMLEAAEWIDGNATSGHQSALAKRNRQLDEDSPVAKELGGFILDALSTNPLFVAAALPLKVYPPLFNRYAAGGDEFGTHVDSAIRIRRGSDFRIRSDLSATLFLSDPGDYDGGVLVIEDPFGPQEVKLAAGSLVVYSASSLHHVTPLTRGERYACFFWIQSMIRDGEARRSLFELDQSIQEVAATRGVQDATVVRLTGVYHNLLRRWAEM